MWASLSVFGSHLVKSASVVYWSAHSCPLGIPGCISSLTLSGDTKGSGKARAHTCCRTPAGRDHLWLSDLTGSDTAQGTLRMPVPGGLQEGTGQSAGRAGNLPRGRQRRPAGRPHKGHIWWGPEVPQSPPECGRRPWVVGSAGWRADTHSEDHTHSPGSPCQGPGLRISPDHHPHATACRGHAHSGDPAGLALPHLLEGRLLTQPVSGRQGADRACGLPGQFPTPLQPPGSRPSPSALPTPWTQPETTRSSNSCHPKEPHPTMSTSAGPLTSQAAWWSDPSTPQPLDPCLPGLSHLPKGPRRPASR